MRGPTLARAVPIAILALSGALALGGCAGRHTGEGAPAAGAAVGGAAATGRGDAATGAEVGAAAGAVSGSTPEKKPRGCFRYDRDGRRYWDDEC